MNLLFSSRLIFLGLICLLLSSSIVNVLANQKPGDEVAWQKESRQRLLNGGSLLASTQADPLDGTLDSELALALARTSPSSTPIYSSTQPEGVINTILYRLLRYSIGYNSSPKHQNRFHKNKLLIEAESVLIKEAELDNVDAIYRLAELNFWGNHSHPRDYQTAFKYYQQISRLSGNTTAQFMVGFIHATGLAAKDVTDQARAMLYYTFAADGGDIRAQMALGHRFHTGISCSRNCEEAEFYYRKAATQVMDSIKNSPLGGPRWVKSAFSLADEVGGAYGEIASTASDGSSKNAQYMNFNSRQGLDDMMEYLDLLSQSGDIKAILTLGKLYYEGSRNLRPNEEAARMYFMNIGRRFWDKTGKKKGKLTTFANSVASECAGYLGMMFMRGEGVEQSFDEAFTWFERGVAGEDSRSQYGLGLLYLSGKGVPKNVMLAAELFGNASDLDFSPAQVEMGRLFLDQGEPITALRYFDLAARSGSPEAFFYLAEMIRQGIGRDQNCAVATLYYKIVTEKAEMITSSFDEAEKAYSAHDFDGLLIRQLLAAEQGFEVAQSNVGYLLDPTESNWSILLHLRNLLQSFKIRIPQFQLYSKISESLHFPGLSIIYYTRAAKQSNIDAMVKVGDFYLSNILHPAPLHEFKPDPEKAAAWYQAAAETLQCGQAMWNLGWMHENGIGMPQSFHLAKRLYDQALVANKKANVPIKLALWKLQLRAFWSKIIGKPTEDITLPREDGDKAPIPTSFTEWMARFLSNAATVQETHQLQADEDGDLTNALGEGWGYDSDGRPVTVGDTDGDLIDDLDDGILESLAIFTLSAVLIFLLVWRQQRMDRQRRQDEERRQQAQAPPPPPNNQANNAAGGVAAHGDEPPLFPDGNNPGFMPWDAGGIGI